MAECFTRIIRTPISESVILVSRDLPRRVYVDVRIPGRRGSYAKRSVWVAAPWSAGALVRFDVWTMYRTWFLLPPGWILFDIYIDDVPRWREESRTAANALRNELIPVWFAVRPERHLFAIGPIAQVSARLLGVTYTVAQRGAL